MPENRNHESKKENRIDGSRLSCPYQHIDSREFCKLFYGSQFYKCHISDINYCTWNRFLIYSALINIVVEWIIVNFDVGCYYNNIMVVTAVISSVLAVGSVLSAIRNKIKGLN